jgi:hypothetical protein
MSDKAKVLLQLDTDPLPSVFDRVVAVDAGADHVFAYGGVTPDSVTGLVHGCIFTRKELNRTAIFIGGSDLAAAEGVLAAARSAMIPQFGLQVSVMLDSNGANTTAAAAVRAAGKHLNLAEAKALVLGGTGPVGQRVARLLAGAGADVRIGSRQKERAELVAAAIRKVAPTARVQAVATTTSADAPAALAGCTLVLTAGAAGIVLLPKKHRTSVPTLQVAIDLNAVPPAGIEGVEATDAGANRDGGICYGALGVGGTKMKIHRAAVAKLFERNDQVLDAETIYELAQQIG